MSKSKSESLPRLGRGLEALIPKSFIGAGKSILQITVKNVSSSPFQPRSFFSEEAIDRLAHSIKKNGLAQPIVVRQVQSSYELIAGERRLKACIKSGITMIPAIIKNVTDEQSLQLALVENLDREDLNPIEVANGYQQLINEFSYTHQDLAELFLKSRSSITNTLRLLQAPKCIQDALMNKSIAEGHARTLLGLEDLEKIEVLLKKILKQELSVREVEKLVAKEKVSRETMPLFKPQDETVVQYEKRFETLGYKANFKGNENEGKIVFHYANSGELESILKRFI